MLSKIIKLIAETTRTPRTGTGKPERLKYLGGEVWSRRITEKDRLVYDIQSDMITIIACRFLDQYREAVENARDPAGWKQLRRVLRLWRFHADAIQDPGYREALDAARGEPSP